MSQALGWRVGIGGSADDRYALDTGHFVPLFNYLLNIYSAPLWTRPHILDSGAQEGKSNILGSSQLLGEHSGVN